MMARTGGYNSFFRYLVALGGAISAPSCSGSGGASIEIVVHAPPPLDTTGHCPEDSPIAPLLRGPEGPTTLRVTYRRSGGLLLCDAIVPLDGPRRLVGVPRGDGQLPPVDVVVEAFRGDAAAGAVLVGSGVAHAVDLGRGGEVQVFVTPRDQFACAQRPSVQGRAFHSATTLPDGRVLLVGGLVADPGDPEATQIRLDQPITGGGFYASASVELYDPDTGTFASLAVSGLTPRAFHSAYVLPGAAGAAPRVLLVGGLAPIGEAGAAPVADGVRDALEPLSLVPTAAAVAAPTEVLTLPASGAATVARLDVPAAFAPRLFASATRAPSPGDDAALPAQLPPLVAGGYATYPSMYDGSFEAADLAGVASQGDATWTLVPAARVGATITWIADDRALVWGGNLATAAGLESGESGNLIWNVPSGAPTSAAVTFDLQGLAPSARAFHAAVPIGTDDLLVVGGFRVAGGSTGEPVTPFAERVRFPAGGTVAVVEAPSAVGAVPAGYLDATPLLGGDALITGGNPALGVADAPCPDGTINFGLCAIDDAWRWIQAEQRLVPAAALLEPRWGHRSTVLRDGTVLVTGGFTNVGTALYVLRAAELYNPRSEALDAAGDALGAGAPPRAPGDVARNAEGAAVSPCAIVELDARTE